MNPLLEPHPVLPLPETNDADELASALTKRTEQITLERLDPFRYGFRPAIWDACDDLLRDGHTIIFDVSRAKLLGCDIDVPKEMQGRRELWVAGGNQSSKTEYAGRKCVETLLSEKVTRSWSFADTSTKSKSQQQPVVFKYLPFEIREVLRKKGKLKHGIETNITYSFKTGFADDNLSLNGSMHWFKNYEQDLAIVEGDQLDFVWLDELRSVTLLKTLRFRMGHRQGIILATFTSINELYADVDDEYNRGRTVVLEAKATLLPVCDDQGNETGEYEKVPRIGVAGPGSDGDQRANFCYFHMTDNPYYGFNPLKPYATSQERFAELLVGANREKILSRAYGILTRNRSVQFPLFSDTIHIVDDKDIPQQGTNYLIVDPCDGRNWFIIWVRITPDDRWYVYREWPSYGHKGAIIPNIGDLGPWTLPGKKPDGEPGPAQIKIGFSLSRYKSEIVRMEGKEEIFERWMDSRYGNTPTTTSESATTLIEQMEMEGMVFRAASGRGISEGTDLINDKLYYDKSVKLGEFSAEMARLNWPRMYVARTCPNVIFALKEWTGIDGNKGACKDCVDVLRYAVMSELGYCDNLLAWTSY